MEKIDYNDFLDFLKKNYDSENFRIVYGDEGLSVQSKKELFKEYAELKKLDANEIMSEVEEAINYVAEIMLYRMRGEDPYENLVTTLSEEDSKKFIEKAESYFINEESLSDLIFKATSKGDFFENIDWEINTKVFERDTKEEAIKKIKIVRLKLKLKGDETKYISFEAGKKGIEEFLKQLNKIYDKFND